MAKIKKSNNIELDWSHFKGIRRIMKGYGNFKNVTLIINQDTETYQLVSENGEILNEISF